MVLKFSEKEPPLTKDPRSLLKTFPFKLPESYLNILKEGDGGYLDYDFKYYDKRFEEEIGGGIGVLYGLSCDEIENLIHRYNNPPELFPKNLVAFAGSGNGDLACFDYRKNPDSDNPPIVYWIHDIEEDKEICPLAKNFEEFLSLLKEPEEVED